jgi:hypothetical protein
MTFRPDGVEVHPVYDLIAGGADYLSDVELINWNVSANLPGFLIRAEGDADAFATDLEAIPRSTIRSSFTWATTSSTSTTPARRRR